MIYADKKKNCIELNLLHFTQHFFTVIGTLLEH